MLTPTKQDVKTLFNEVKEKYGVLWGPACYLLAASANVSKSAVEQWLGSGNKLPSKAAWRCLNLDFREIDLNKNPELMEEMEG